MLKILACIVFTSILNFSYAQLFGGQIKTNKTWANSYPSGSIFCASGPTAIVEVTNPTTGKVWMDRNLGASQVATSSTDAAAYGDLYQWGRRSDGHQCRNSATTTTLSSVDQPAHGDFIRSSLEDWRSPMNDNLWQGINGVNNPCPFGFRIPIRSELENEQWSWSSANDLGGFNSPLKFTIAGYRRLSNGVLSTVGTQGYYCSSTISTNRQINMYYSTTFANFSNGLRGHGFSVRCIKN